MKPGIVKLLTEHPQSGNALSQLAQTLLATETSLTPLQKEVIAAEVSKRNGCEFCERSHRAIAEGQSKKTSIAVSEVIKIQPMQSLIYLAAVVADSVDEYNTAKKIARANGATEEQIRETILIAAAFCMFNRYVEGNNPDRGLPDKVYRDIGENIAQRGYL